MAIDPISMPAAISPTKVMESQAAKPAAGTGFDDWMQVQLDTLNQQILEADTKVQQLAAGEEANLHDVMISLEKAKMSFELVLAVRNKALEAYQELMRMQI